MKKIIAALAVTIGLLVGGAGVVAPAQAVNGSTVYYGGASDANKRLITRTMGGTTVYQVFKTSVGNVYRTCPPQSNMRIYYIAPSGGQGWLGYGTCLYPSQTGTYTVSLSY